MISMTKKGMYIFLKFIHSVKKSRPDTNELFVRTEFEFEDDEDMDAFLHKLLYFKEPEWFHDLTHEEIVQLNCVFEQYEPVLGSLIERKAANQ